MTIPIKKVIDIIHEIISVLKSAGKGLQISGDVATAKRIKKAIKENNIVKLKKILTRGGVFIDEKDIMGIFQSKKNPGVLVSVDYVVRDKQMSKIIRRYKRKEG